MTQARINFLNLYLEYHYNSNMKLHYVKAQSDNIKSGTIIFKRRNSQYL